MSGRPQALRPGATAAVTLLMFVASLLAVASCAAIGSNNASLSSDSTVTTNASSAGAVRVNRLAEAVTYVDGQERFDPLPSDYQPKIDATQAFAAFTRSVNPQSLGTGEQPTILLALYSNFDTGKQATFVTGTMDPVAAARSDEASKPAWVNVPVWYIRYLHVPIAPAGAPAAPGSSQQSTKSVIQELVAPVSAETGQVLLKEYVSADRTPTSWIAPPTGTG